MAGSRSLSQNTGNPKNGLPVSPSIRVARSAQVWPPGHFHLSLLWFDGDFAPHEVRVVPYLVNGRLKYVALFTVPDPATSRPALEGASSCYSSTSPDIKSQGCNSVQ
jgi:hypothetical protein